MKRILEDGTPKPSPLAVLEVDLSGCFGVKEMVHTTLPANSKLNPVPLIGLSYMLIEKEKQEEQSAKEVEIVEQVAAENVEEEAKPDAAVDEDPVEPTTKEVVHEVAEEPKQEVVQEVAEEPKKEVVQEVAEEPKQKVTKEVVEEPKKNRRGRKAENWDYVGIIKKIMSRRWNKMHFGRWLDHGKILEFPSSTFPILATLTATKLFKKDIVSDEDYESAISAFVLACDSKVFSLSEAVDKKIVVLITTVMVLNNWKKVETYDTARIYECVVKLMALMKKFAMDFITPFLEGFRVVIKKFMSGNFEADPLIAEFSYVMESITSMLHYPPEVKKYFVDLLYEVLENKLVNTIISNPQKFTFTSAIAWNSFVSVFEQVQCREMKNLRKYIRVFLLAPMLANEETREATKSDLSAVGVDPRFVTFVMSNFVPDDVLTADEINVDSFVESEGRVESYGPVPVVAPGFEEFIAACDFDVSGWEYANIGKSVVREFPFFVDVTKGDIIVD